MNLADMIKNDTTATSNKELLADAVSKLQAERDLLESTCYFLRRGHRTLLYVMVAICTFTIINTVITTALYILEANP